MKIYTYYEKINHVKQEEMIELWKESWSYAGFDPVVLGIDNAKENPFYEVFDDKIQYLHLAIKAKKIENYGMSCYRRWLAYSCMKEEYFYVSDYDVLNNGFQPTIPEDKLHFMSNACPCIASGKPSQFLLFCSAILKISEERIEKLIKFREDMHWYHDQEFLHYNLATLNSYCQKIKETYNIKLSWDLAHDYKNNQLPKLPHISHNFGTLHKKDGEAIIDTRLRIMKRIVESNRITDRA